MRKNIHLKITYNIVALMLFVCYQSIYAQENSPAAIEIMKKNNLWQQTSNAAGLQIDIARKYSLVSIGQDVEMGNFHRLQDGEKVYNTNVNAEGLTFINNVSLWGSFKYSHENSKDNGFNASIIDPYRGMPYYIADTNLSDWRRQFYDLRFKAATETNNAGFSFGVEGIYKAAEAAKQRDIRAENKQMFVQLKPGIVYSSPSRNHILGINADFYSIKEESSNSNVNVYIDQDYYELFGLGTAIKRIGSGRISNYTGVNWGGGLQYNFANDNLNLLISSDYSTKVERLENSFSMPRKEGGVTDKISNTEIKFYTIGDGNYTHYINAQFVIRKIDGVQYINQRDKSANQLGWLVLYNGVYSKYNTTNISLNYDFLKKYGESEFSYIVGFGVDYSNNDDHFILPFSEKKAENIIVNISGKRNFVLNENYNGRFLIGAKFMYNNNLSGVYNYNGKNASSPIITVLEKGEHAFLTSNYWGANVEATYSQKLKYNSQINGFAKATINYLKCTNESFNSRTFFNISIGATF